MTTDAAQYHPLPQPAEVSIREKEDAMGAYLMMFAAIGAGLPLPIINLIASIVYYYLNRSASRFVRFHSMQSLYSQIPVTLLNAGVIMWTIKNLIRGGHFSDSFWGYLAMVVIANIVYFIFSIIAAVKARRGYLYYFIFFGKVCYENVFRIRSLQENAVNKPPF